MLVHLQAVLPLFDLAHLLLQATLLGGQHLDLLLHLGHQGRLLLRGFECVTPELFTGGLLFGQGLALLLGVLKQGLSLRLRESQSLGLLTGLRGLC